MIIHAIEKRLYHKPDIPYFIVKLYNKQHIQILRLCFNNLNYLQFNETHINDKYACYIESTIFDIDNINEYINYLLINNIVHKTDNTSNLYELTPIIMLQLF